MLHGIAFLLQFQHRALYVVNLRCAGVLLLGLVVADGIIQRTDGVQSGDVLRLLQFIKSIVPFLLQVVKGIYLLLYLDALCLCSGFQQVCIILQLFFKLAVCLYLV